MNLPLLPPGTGVMLCGHGSRNRLAVAEFAVLADALRAKLPGIPVEYGYLEFADPVIHHGLDRLRAQGLTRILAVPGMLFAAGHAKNDIPSVLNTYAAMHSGLEITYGRELGVDLKMLRAAGDRIAEAIAASSRKVANTETLLLVVGRGASDPDANANVAKVMRLLWEGMGFGWGEVAYSGVTFPLVAPALDHAAKLGYRRIVVFPYFLFTGVLVKRIYAAAEEAQARHPGIEILNAPYLNDHPLVVETFLDRLREMLVGQNLMNCSLCKYREQVLGFEAEVGLAQASHHHHVEGIGGGLENCPCSGDCDASCRDEAFCKAHDLPWTPLHAHDHAAPSAPPPFTGEGDHTKYGGEGGHTHPHPHLHHHHDAPHALLATTVPPLVKFDAKATDHSHNVAGAHHHHPYPHAHHPHGPVTLRRGSGQAGAQGEARVMDYLRDPAAIYEKSFALIRAEVDLAALPATLHDPALRMIHACGMPDLAADIAGDPEVAQAIRAALASGAPILCDCEMVRAGIATRHLKGNDLVVTLNDPAVPALAARLGTTRSAAAVELWRDRLAGAIVVIGNAPTALLHLLDILAVGHPSPSWGGMAQEPRYRSRDIPPPWGEGGPRDSAVGGGSLTLHAPVTTLPAAIIATPVGFVGAAESKERLIAEAPVPYLTVRGRRGGSAIASAALNAIAAGAAS